MELSRGRVEKICPVLNGMSSTECGYLLTKDVFTFLGSERSRCANGWAAGAKTPARTTWISYKSLFEQPSVCDRVGFELQLGTARLAVWHFVVQKNQSRLN